MLHIILQSPISHAVLARISSGDAVLFQQAAAFSCFCDHPLEKELINLQKKTCQLHVLYEDLIIYGINVERLLPGILIIDYSGFVELTLENKQIKTWR